MITTMRGCVTYNDFWPWPISSRSFRHELAIKLLKYVTSCCVRSTAYTVLHGFFPYLAQMTTGMRGCHAQRPFILTYVFKVIQAWLGNKTAKTWHILPCPILIMYSSGWILSIFGTNHQQHERVCHVWRPLTLTYIFKVIQSWLCK